CAACGAVDLFAGLRTSELAELFSWPHRKLRLGVVHRPGVRAALQLFSPAHGELKERLDERGTPGTALVANPSRYRHLRFPYCSGVLLTDGAHRTCLWRTALPADPRLSADAPFHAPRTSWRARSGAAVGPG